MVTVIAIYVPLVVAPFFIAFILNRSDRGNKFNWEVAQSLLLSVYFFLTSGLGIYWVYRQDLPLLDLHHIFGLCSCVIASFHLYVNGGKIRTLLTRRRMVKRQAISLSHLLKKCILPIVGFGLAATGWFIAEIYVLLASNYGLTELLKGIR